MNPLDEGDAGELGAVFDTITGAVNSVERFGQSVNNITTFSMSQAMIWAIILFMFFTLFVRLGRPWSDAAARRYESDKPVFPPRTGPSREDYEALEDKLAKALATIELMQAGNSVREPEEVA